MKNNEIICKRPAPRKATYTTENLEVGQVGVLAEQYKGCLIMKMFGNALVLLDNPEHTWNHNAILELKEILPTGTRIEIILSK